MKGSPFAYTSMLNSRPSADADGLITVESVAMSVVEPVPSTRSAHLIRALSNMTTMCRFRQGLSVVLGAATLTVVASTNATSAAAQEPPPSSSSSPSPAAAGPCNAAPDPSVSLDAETITATGAARVTARTVPNHVVDLFAYTHPSTTFVLVRSQQTGQDGLATFTIKPPANTRLYAAQRGCADRHSPSIVLNVRTALTLGVARNGVRDYTFSGDSLPARPGGLIVSLYRITDAGALILTAQARADGSNGEWLLDRRFSGSGRYGFVVRTGQDLQNAPGSSNIRSLLVY